jgi:hypothetical protein
MEPHAFPPLRDQSLSDLVNEANILEPGDELTEVLKHGLDVVNARRKPGEALIDPTRPIVVALYPFRAELAKKGAPSDTYDADPKKRTSRQHFVDQLWVLPFDALTSGKLGVVGSLAIRKYGGSDVYGVFVLEHARGYVAPVVLEQFATGKLVNGLPWLHVGQVDIHLSRDGMVRANRVQTFEQLETLEFNPASLAKSPSEVVDVVLYFAANINRVVGLIAVRVHIYDSFRELFEGYNPLDPKQRDVLVLPLEHVLRGQDGRSQAAFMRAALHSSVIAKILVQVLGYVHPASA